MKKESLTQLQSQAVIHLVEAETVSKAAELTGVSRPTLYSWMKEPAFRAELAQARRADHEARLNQLRGLMPKAISVLSRLLENVDPNVRFKAAKEVVRAYQALADSEPPAAATQPVEPMDELTAAGLKEFTQSCVSRLMDGSLEARAAQMLPSYLRLLERLTDEEAVGSNGKREGEPEDAGEPGEVAAERRPGAAPPYKAIRREVARMLEAARGDLEAVARGRSQERKAGA